MHRLVILLSLWLVPALAWAGGPFYDQSYPTPNDSQIGSYDSSAQTGGYFYKVFEFTEGWTTAYSTATSGASNSASGVLAGPRANDNNTVNAYDVSAVNHVGVMGAFTLSVGYSQIVYVSNIAFAPDQGVTTTIRILFRTPSAVSDVTNDYTMYVGPMSISAGTVIRGWWIKYNHATNSGNWQIGSINSGSEPENLINTSVAFTANTWQTLVITMPASGHTISYSLTCNGTTSVLGTLTDSFMEAPVVGAAANVAGVSITRNATDGAAWRSAYVDRASVFQTGRTTQGN